MNRKFGYLILLVLVSFGLYSQELIQELSIGFDDADNGIVSILTGNGDCDANPGVFGISNGAFVINDMEGATCCTNSPLQGMNDNRALLGPIIALSAYCDVSIAIDVSLSATDFESCLSRDINPIGCTAFIPTFDPGGDGFQLETMLNGNPILNSGYCGQQRRGIFQLNIGDLEIGDVFTFLITGGTQDQDEIYSINSIEFTGRQRSLIPAMIATTDTVLCEGLDPLILTEISGGIAYQWSKDGEVLPSNTLSYNSSGVVTLDDQGLYSVTVTDAGGCITVDEVLIEVIPLSTKRLDPTFASLPLSYCIGDTIFLPSQSDEGVIGNWNITSPFIIDDENNPDSLHFVPDDILFESVSFDIEIQDYVMASYVDTICAGATIILEGERFDSSRLEGSFIAAGGPISCDTLYSVSLVLAHVDTTQFNQTVCPGDTFDIGGELFHFGRLTGNVLVPNAERCLTYVEVTLSRGTIQITRDYDPCNDIPIFPGVIIDQDTSYLISGNGLICDSLINISYQPSQGQDSILIIELCPEDSILINEVVYSMNNRSDTLTIISDMGCPKDLIIAVTFSEEIILPYQIRSICSGDTIQVVDELFYEGKLSGLVRSVSDGCDTLYDVNLSVNQEIELMVEIDPCIGVSSFKGIDILRDTSIVAFSQGVGCDTIYNIAYEPGFLEDSLFQIMLCSKDSISIGGDIYHAANTSGRFEITSELGCRRNVIVDIEIADEIVEFLRDTFCEGIELSIGGEIFGKDNPSGSVLFSREGRCDSVIFVELEVIVPVERELNIAICDGDTINVRGVEFYNGVEEAPIVYGPNGCDTVLSIIPTYLQTRNAIFEMSFCTDVDVEVGGEVFNASRATGTVVIPLDDGCDSIVDIRLEYFSGDTIVIDRQLCEGDSVVVGGVIYSEANPSGIEVLTSQLGCDSLIRIDLNFASMLTTRIEPLICPEEQIFIGSQSYDARNLTGIERFTTSGGCDSIVEVAIQLDTVEVSISATGTCRQSRAGSIEVTVLSQDTFQISLAGVTTARAATSIVFEDLTIGEYMVVVESARSCFFIYPTEVEATFSNEVSYTLTDNGVEFYDVSVDVSGPFQDIIWEPSPDLSCIDCLNPRIRKGGVGEYRAVIQDLNGCIEVIVISTGEESQAYFYIPNVISKNGDSDNRSFHLQASEEGVLSYDMTIYDRWGQPMYVGSQILPNDADAGWRGLRDGSWVSNGVYVYSILIRMEDGTEEQRFGELLVID